MENKMIVAVQEHTQDAEATQTKENVRVDVTLVVQLHIIMILKMQSAQRRYLINKDIQLGTLTPQTEQHVIDIKHQVVN
jgi:hypothetical protein